MNAARHSLKPLTKPLTKFFESAVEDESSVSSDGESLFLEEDRKIGGKPAKFAEKEDRRVNIWRSLVLLMLIAAGATTSVLTFLILDDEADREFVSSYDLFVQNIKDASVAFADNVETSFESLSQVISSSSLASDTRGFPFVNVPGFEIKAEYIRRLTGVEMIMFTPVVEPSQSDEWVEFASNNQQWIQDSRQVGANGDSFTPKQQVNITPMIFEHNIDLYPSILKIPSDTDPFLPIWLLSPPPFYPPGIINYNRMAESDVQSIYPLILEQRSKFFGGLINASRIGSAAINLSDHAAFHAQFQSEDMSIDENFGFSHPHCMLFYPVYESVADRFSKLVGLIHGILPWDYFVQGLVPEGVSPIHAVVESSCNQVFTYLLNGTRATYLGMGDFHNNDYDNLKRTIDVMDQKSIPEGYGTTACNYRFQIYPTEELSDQYDTRLPLTMAAVVAATFFAMATTFFMYDNFVRRRNAKVVNAAVKSERIVSSFFPSNVRDRVMAQEVEAEKHEVGQQHGTQTRLKKFLANETPTDHDMETEDIMFKTQPIADLFPETTILFADIAGFTAWSSAREPSQVFTLLETVYKSFDEIAKRRRVFKVETVGDCYVAATGLPEPRKDHAVAMARFAKDCVNKMQALTRKLEVSLGPDTADLAMRVGLHSGPVTAGVLRGEKSRFQLFGDTMNTASRMESTGVRDKIQISQDTADLLVAAGKESWITPREDIVSPKGKGHMVTYWLDIGKRSHEGMGLKFAVEDRSGEASVSSDDVSETDDDEQAAGPSASAKIARLIDWNVDVLLQLLKSIVARRKACGHPKDGAVVNEDFSRKAGTTVLDEVEERIALPEFDPAIAKKQLPPEKIDVDAETQSQLYEYIAAIAAMYRDNPFHNFEHASHVAMSVSKLLSRIVAPTDLDFRNSDMKSRSLHDHTYGITSDPLTQFACVLSALIHDVDHTGVPNTQLVKENTAIAKYYGGRSVAEQNSVDVAWDLLVEDTYSKLRHTIYTTNEELQRFRKLVVNSVMATDIMDKELKDRRNARWDLAFSENATDDPLATVQRKATIVIEHLIQASDVAHTMQHWHIYRKWNGRLFEEMYKAYKEGRSEKDPSEFWYKGEIGFFDFYIIPLAKKLKDCGVFGVSSDEYLNYAEHNRKEWEAKGQQVVSELIEHAKAIYDEPEMDLPRSMSPPPPTLEIQLTTI